MKKEYVKVLRQLKRKIKKSKECDEQKILLLAIDTYIETINNQNVTDENIIEYLKSFK